MILDILYAYDDYIRLDNTPKAYAITSMPYGFRLVVTDSLDQLADPSNELILLLRHCGDRDVIILFEGRRWVAEVIHDHNNNQSQSFLDMGYFHAPYIPSFQPKEA